MPRLESAATVAEKHFLFTARIARACAPQSPDLSSYHAHQDAHPALLQQLPAYQASPALSHHSQPQYPLQPPPWPPPPPQHIPRPMLQNQLAPQSYMPRNLTTEESMPDADYMPDASLPLAPDAASGLSGADMPNTDHITIKNHFPVARIKRIMQADDDVGKVAQVTPVVVSKALELFMISLVTKAAAEAKSRNSKRVGSIHLKQAIAKTDRFDFLNEIVSKVADAPEKSEGDNADADGKKKKTSSRKKKKADSDEDF